MHIYKRLLVPFNILVIIIITGTAGFYFVSRGEESLFNRLDMTFITINTIGYGEIIDVSRYEYGRSLVIIIAISGIAGFT
ncbi:MAG: hypothetical protein GX452_09195 [Ignavibacteriales bacterium]|nr:ion channel [Ignavibacteriaceae bacterium]NLH61569.1 hypothetical protein [Ignavibacteriales bacterium]HOJ18238.1 ion channel [Ignavibacteriaceae bacterium]HPO55826.1 ion channel [Ignavibacteriaceae bacterium]